VHVDVRKRLVSRHIDRCLAPRSCVL